MSDETGEKKKSAGFFPPGVVAILVMAVSAQTGRAEDPPFAKAPFSAEEAADLQKAWAGHLGKDPVFTNSIGMKIALIPPGQFMMGTSEADMRRELEQLKAEGSKWYEGSASGRSIETPLHPVRLTKPFYMGVTEVTVGQFRKFVEATGYETEAERGLVYGNPSKAKNLRTWKKHLFKQTDEHPVLQLSQRDCKEFCRWLSEKEGQEYALPTEAQWEYACRAGTTSLWHFAGPDRYDDLVEEYAWMSWDRRQPAGPKPVGGRKPNAFGLHDMHGNVWEYMSDWYHEFYYKESPLNDPAGPETFNEMRDGRVMIRGGSFDWADYGARAAIRMRIRQDSNQHPHMGFRVVLNLKDAKGIPPLGEDRPAVRKDSAPESVEPVDAAKAQASAVSEKFPREVNIPLADGVDIEFVLIPPGTFLMGDADGLRDERPLHKVTITKPFYMGKFEVTQGQWEALFPGDDRLANWRKNPKTQPWVGPDNPMSFLDWHDCRKFIEALGRKAPGHRFSLPTEAQWEYACRAGSRSDYSFGDDPAQLPQYATVCADDALPFRERDTVNLTVGARKPNDFGLHDMHGGLWEWTADWYGNAYYGESPVTNPSGPGEGLMRVLRGGSFFRYGKYARSAFRLGGHPDGSSSDYGMRVVMTLAETGAAATAAHPPLAKAPFDAGQAADFQKQWAGHIGKPAVHTNSIGMELKLIPPGEFTMGRTESQFDKVLKLAEEGGREPARAAVWEMLMMPAHTVRITKPFYLGATEVTVGQYRQFCEESGYQTEAEQGLNGGVPYKGGRPICTWRKPMVWIKLQQKDDEPVLHLCWNDCVAFCKWLSEKEGVEYVLPTEAEWEYACRAGTETAWSFGNFEDFDRLGHEYLFVSEEPQGKHDRPSSVARKKPNAFGLYDMHGNVWEYVADWWHRFTYKNSPVNDPTGPPEQSEKGDMRRIIRAGSFDWGRWGAQSVYRMRIGQRSTQHPHQGFRVAMRIEGVKGVPPAPEPFEERRKNPIDPGADSKAVLAALKAGHEQTPPDLPGELTVGLPDGEEMDFVLIPAGSFLMGSGDGFGDETPVHRVVISKPFYMARHEVTTGQWAALMGKDDRFKFWESMTGEHDDAIGPRKAMRDVSWNECRDLVAALQTKTADSLREAKHPLAGLAGYRFSLPTEAQWERACRAGSTTEFHFGNDASVMGDYAWFAGNMIWPGGGRTFPDGTPVKGVHYHEVGQKKPNAYGLFDMHGGVWEWCADFYDRDYYADSPLADPTGPETGKLRTLRGGSWFRYAKYCRSAYRRFFHAAANGDGVTAYISDFGCRVVINLDDAQSSAAGNDPSGTVDYIKLARSLARHPGNPVIRVGKKGEWDDQTLGCFTVLEDGGKFFFYSGGTQFGQPKKIGMATSPDGIRWTKSEQNPLFPGSMPYAIKVGDTYRLYHPGKDAKGKHGLLMKTSKDGFTWSEPKLVLAGAILDPCVVRAGEKKFHLYFCSGGKKNKGGKQVWEFKNYVATSEDGISWKKQPEPVLPLGTEGDWDSQSHAGPCVLKLEDGFHMWYLGSGSWKGGKTAWRIGHATSPDGLTWTRSAGDPVLDIGEEGAWDGGTFMSFDIIFREGKFLFWYAAAPTGHGDETKMTIQIGHGTSR